MLGCYLSIATATATAVAGAVAVADATGACHHWWKHSQTLDWLSINVYYVWIIWCGDMQVLTTLYTIM